MHVLVTLLELEPGLVLVLELVPVLELEPVLGFGIELGLEAEPAEFADHMHYFLSSETFKKATVNTTNSLQQTMKDNRVSTRDDT